MKVENTMGRSGYGWEERVVEGVTTRWGENGTVEEKEAEEVTEVVVLE